MSGANGQELPTGWAATKLSDILETRSGKADPQSMPDAKFIGMEQVEAHTMRLLGTVPCGSMKSGANTFYPKDVLYGRLRSYLNKVYQPDFAGLCSGEFIVFPETSAVLGRFLKYRLNAGDFVRFASRINTGDRPRVDFDQLKVFDTWLPPRAEQERIADALDELFSDLDAGVVALERTREKLKLYRASVLKAAVDGTLTADWRAQHPQTEPAAELLKRILVERRRRWEEDQLAKFKPKGKEPPKNWRTKYREPVGPGVANLPPLPEGWCWATFDQIAGLITKGSSPGWQGFQYQTSGVPFVRSQNIRWGSLDLTDIEYLSSEFNMSHSGSIVQAGDVLLNLVGASVGRCAIATEQIDGANLNQAVGIIRLIPNEVANRWIMMYVISYRGQRHIHTTKADVARANFNLDDLRPMPVPLPPSAEQTAIIEGVEDQLSVIELLDSDLDTKLKSAQTLRHAILRHAFTGQLMPQDPNDEPASELLKRISTEREARAREVAAARRASKKKTDTPRTGRRGRSRKTRTKDK